jgi:hypothetical protein
MISRILEVLSLRKFPDEQNLTLKVSQTIENTGEIGHCEEHPDQVSNTVENEYCQRNHFCGMERAVWAGPDEMRLSWMFWTGPDRCAVLEEEMRHSGMIGPRFRRRALLMRLPSIWKVICFSLSFF